VGGETGDFVVEGGHAVVDLVHAGFDGCLTVAVFLNHEQLHGNAGKLRDGADPPGGAEVLELVEFVSRYSNTDDFCTTVWWTHEYPLQVGF